MKNNHLNNLSSQKTSIITDIDYAVRMLREGGVVAFPTETVYGLGADAKNLAALQKIFHIKQRPINHPVILHIASLNDVDAWALNFPKMAIRLAEAFWPGPMTLILNKSAHVSDLITGGQDSVGIRIPQHPVAQQLLKEFGSGLAAPSANRFGHISPTTASAVQEELGNSICVLEGGQSVVGLESTIIDVRGEEPIILRPGMIGITDIEICLKQSVKLQNKISPRVSGSLDSHYAPRTPCFLLSQAEILSELQYAFEESVGFMLFASSRLEKVTESNNKRQKNHALRAEVIVMPNNPIDYAHCLYQTLREMDKQNLKKILIEIPPQDPTWIAINDRLIRACQKK